MLCIVILSLGLDGFFNLNLKFSLHSHKVQNLILYRQDLVFVFILDVFIPLQNLSIQILKRAYVNCFVDAVVVRVLGYSQPV